MTFYFHEFHDFRDFHDFDLDRFWFVWFWLVGWFGRVCLVRFGLFANQLCYVEKKGRREKRRNGRREEGQRSS